MVNVNDWTGQPEKANGGKEDCIRILKSKYGKHGKKDRKKN